MNDLQLELFPSIGEIQLPVDYYPNFLSSQDADWLLEQSKLVDWQQNRTKMFGKDLGPKPRLESIYGDEGCNYIYSGNILLQPLPWNEPLLWLRDKVEAVTKHRYNITIGNWYRSGTDSISWHDDNRPLLGNRPAIASVTVGAVRRFSIKSKDKNSKAFHFDLAHGSLLFMHPGCQDTHIHCVPKTKSDVGDRINWTFRPHIYGAR